MTALPAVGPQVLNVAGIETLLGGILGLVVILVAIRFMLHAHRSNYAAVLGGLGIVLLGLLVFALRSPDHLNSMSTTLFNLIF